jgi:hypothetical protein
LGGGDIKVSFDVLIEKGVLFNRVRVSFGLFPPIINIIMTFQ